jgi:hypothetical protein
MVTKSATALLLGGLLAGCAVPYSPVPNATNFPISKQEKLQAAAHWGTIANHIEKRVAAALRSAAQRPLYVTEPPQASPFQRAMTAQLVSSLVNDGFVVSRSPAGALRLDLDVQALTFGADRPQYRYTGAASAIAAGVWVLTEVDPALALIAAGGAADGYHWFNSKYAPGETPRTELIVTLSVSDQYRYLARATSAYYVADNDRALYGIKDELPKEAQATKLFQVRGDH